MRVMIIDENHDRAERLASDLSKSRVAVCAVETETIHLYDKVLSFAPDIILIDAHMPQRDTLEHLANVHKHCPRPVMLLVDTKYDTRILQQASHLGVSIFASHELPINAVSAILATTIANFREHQKLRTELAEAKKFIKDGDAVRAAKRILMREKHLTENEAHKIIREAAMARRVQMKSVAEEILSSASLKT